MADSIRVNGVLYSWGHITIKIGNEVFTGFDQINYGDKRERVKGYGTGRHHAPRGRSMGKYSTDPVQLRGFRSTCHALREYLASLATDGVSYGSVEFPIMVQLIEPGSLSEVPMTIELERAVLVADKSSNEENPDPLKEELECDVMLIRRNGKTLFDSTLGSP
jgi:hypothetical protein